MERDDRAVVASFFVPTFAEGADVVLPEGAAHHARVKRLAVGEMVQVTDGAGVAGMGSLTEVGKQRVLVRITAARRVPRLPAVHLFVPVADRDRMLLLAEKCVELSVTSWQPVYFNRSRSVQPRGEGEAFDAKVRARMIAALEQSGGAWLPEMHSPIALRNAMACVAETRLVFDAAGDHILGVPIDGVVAAMIGPEGGIEDEELDALRGAGWRMVRLEGNVLRFESAGIAAAAILRTLVKDARIQRS